MKKLILGVATFVTTLFTILFSLSAAAEYPKGFDGVPRAELMARDKIPPLDFKRPAGQIKTDRIR